MPWLNCAALGIMQSKYLSEKVVSINETTFKCEVHFTLDATLFRVEQRTKTTEDFQDI